MFHLKMHSYFIDATINLISEYHILSFKVVLLRKHFANFSGVHYRLLNIPIKIKHTILRYKKTVMPVTRDGHSICV